MAQAFHGGAFWESIGSDFRCLDRRQAVINADVLDAWFDPSPFVTQALLESSAWISKTSPPTDAMGVARSVSDLILVNQDSILIGAGSSALIYLALGHWLTSQSKVLVPEPTYGEYSHYCDEVVRCRCDHVELHSDEDFRLGLGKWLQTVQKGEYDLAVLVNPNNPTGQVLDHVELDSALRQVPRSTRVLVDEAYLDYVGGRSIAYLAAELPNIFLVKSLSKVLALSGQRIAYLVGHPDELLPLKALTPPWAVSLPAQIASVAALSDLAYYRNRYQETEAMRELLSCGLMNLGLERQLGNANWLLCELPPSVQGSKQFVQQASRYRLFLRDAGATAPSLSDRWIRIAVKDLETQRRILDIIRDLVCPAPGSHSVK